ncbi:MULTISPECIES: helicase associated domain-containing protein [unclassified Arthrobacter]|uniref:helicase associated domain-containing protein n=1 Tax=unclassified Arthrobacter TaxID=235627 RepID=UPI0012EA9B27|nr:MULTISPECIES: helicase associated domain-containing protein [unclassified Arthrobacter]
MPNSTVAAPWCWPPVVSKDPIERRLTVWVAGQRKQILNGSISNDRRELLQAAFGDWVGLPPPAPETSMWDRRLTEVADVFANEGHPPRFRRGDDRHENTLATWLVTQRGLHRRGNLAGHPARPPRTGTLDPTRQARLDEQLPGWVAGWR